MQILSFQLAALLLLKILAMQPQNISREFVEPVLVPLYLATVPAGFPSPAIDYMEERIDLAKQLAPHPLATFYVRSTGDSMLDAFIPPGSLLIVDKSLTPKNNDIVVAYLDGGFTVKYIELRSDACWLVPANKAKGYAPIRITEDMAMTVWGVVTSVVIETKTIQHVRAR